MKRVRVGLILLSIIIFSINSFSTTKNISKEKEYGNDVQFFYKEQLRLLEKYRWNEEESREEILGKKGKLKDEVGSVRDFWVNSDYNDEGTGDTITATCRAVTEYAYLYVSDNSWDTTYANQDFVDNISNVWNDAVPADENQGIYEMCTGLFGTPPDVDGEEKIYILVFNMTPGVLGYFSPANEFFGQGNDMEILHLDSNSVSGSSEILQAALAHEFQHMIHFGKDSQETLWINEACSMYAEIYCGWYDDVAGYISDFAENPNASFGDYVSPASSGQGALFMTYLAEQYGEEIIGALLQNTETGLSGINSTLANAGYDENINDLFRNWIIANFVDNPNIYEGQYGYVGYDFPQFSSTNYYQIDNNISDVEQIKAYGTKYLEFLDSEAGEIDFNFSGEIDKAVEITAIKYTELYEQIVEPLDFNENNEATYSVNMSEIYQVVFAITCLDAFSEGDAEVSWSIDDGHSSDYETFEDYSDGDLQFGDWITFDADGAITGGINGYDFPHSYDAFAWTVVDWSDYPNVAAASGEKTVATMYNADESANDDWLISPIIDLTAKDILQVSYGFKTFILNNDYGPEKLEFLVSANGGTAPEDFTSIEILELNDTFVWEEHNIDIDNSFFGNEIRVAFRYISEYALCILLDDAGEKILIGDGINDLYTGFSAANYPNPFNPNTTIEFFIPSSGIVELSIYNLLGQKVKTLVNESMEKGEHSVVWNGRDDKNQSVSSGVYFYRLISDGKEEAKGKMLLVK